MYTVHSDYEFFSFSFTFNHKISVFKLEAYFLWLIDEQVFSIYII